MDRHFEQNSIRLGSGTGLRVANELRAYWEALRGGRTMPSRAEIDPRGIERALEFAFILERVAPGMGRFRLAGMHINDLMGMEVRGMPLTSLFAPEARNAVSEMTEAVFSRPAIAEARLEAQSGIGKPELAGHLLMLPLTSDFGEVTRALGCFVAEGAIGRTPRRFTLGEGRIKPLEARVADTPAPLAFAEAQTPYAPPAPTDAPRKTPQEHFAEMTPEERRAMFRIVREPN